MKPFINFYETLKEAHMRLRSTVVMYDKVPYYVLAITNHHKDGIFRIYLSPLFQDENKAPDWPACIDQFPPDNPGLGPAMDDFLDKNPSSAIIRKQMNSPLFDRYRPFPLGMCNCGTSAFYLERAPARPRTEQGLSQGMIQQTYVELNSRDDGPPHKYQVPLMSRQMHECIVAQHPPARMCLEKMLSGEYANEAVAFHREFAFVRGPLGMIFLGYKTDIVGVLPQGNTSQLQLGREFQHCREVCLDLGLFDRIN